MYNDTFMVTNPYVKKRPVRILRIGTLSDKKTYTFTLKAPSHNTFVYVYEGEFSVDVDNSSFLAKQGDMFWLPEKQPYSFTASPHLPWKYIFININDELIYSILKAYKIKNTYLFPNFNDPTLFEEFVKTAKEAYEPDELSDKEAIIFLKIVQKMRQMLDDVTFKPTDAPKLANFIKSNIDLGINHGINLNNITERTYCSKNHAIRVFKQTFGMTPYQYIIEKKTTIAKDLILESNYNIKQIADLLHFKSSNDFSTFFKRNTGMTPTQFKNANK